MKQNYKNKFIQKNIFAIILKITPSNVEGVTQTIKI